MSSISNQPGIPDGFDQEKIEKKESDVTIKIIPNSKKDDLSQIRAQDFKEYESSVNNLSIEKIAEVSGEFENNENIDVEVEELSDFIDLSDLEDTESSPSAEVDHGKDPMLKLMKEKYELAKGLKDNILNIVNVPQGAVNFVSSAAVVLPVVSVHLDNPLAANDVSTLKADLGTIAFAYNVPKDLGNVALLIYLNKQLGNVENQVAVMENESKLLGKKLRGSGLSEGERAKLAEKKENLDKEIKTTKEYIAKEKGDIATEAKKIIIKNGVALPGNLLTMMRILSITSPILKLGLVWASGVFGAAGAGLVMLFAKKDLAGHKKQMETYREDAFRHGNVLNIGEEPKPVQETEIRWTKRSLSKEIDLKEGEEATYDRAFNEINPSEKTITTVKQDPVGQQSYAAKLEERKQNLLGMKDQLVSKRAYMDRFEDVLHSVKSQKDVDTACTMLREACGDLSEDFSNITIEELGKKLSDKGQLVSLKDGYAAKYKEQTYQQAFDAFMQDIHADLDKVINEETIEVVSFRNMFEKAGMNVPYEVEELLKSTKTQPGLAGDIKALLEKPEVIENLLTRFIDVNSSQQMTDSARNVIKTQTIKKQGRQLLQKLRNYSKAKIIFGGAVVAATSIITMTSLVAFASVSIPIGILLAPAIGMTALSAGFVLLGLKRFRKDRPEEFKQTTIKDQIKLTAYSIPKGIHELRLQKNKVSKLMKIQKRKIMELELNDKKDRLKAISTLMSGENAPTDGKKSVLEGQKQEAAKEVKRLEKEMEKLDGQIEKSARKSGSLKNNIQKYAGKVNPIQARRNEGKLKDRLETERPFKKDVEKMLNGIKNTADKERLIGLFRGYGSMSSGEAINLITDALMRDTSLMDEDVKKMAAYMGIDLTDKLEAEEVKNLVKQFFLGG